ncbi:MAG: hypothetical protein WD824_23300 [Cyclobacteriaceae bacterium]
MDLLILILFIIAGITALILIVPLFIKRDYTIQRDIVINKPRQEVFNYVKFSKNQDYFSKWVMTDPRSSPERIREGNSLNYQTRWDRREVLPCKMVSGH